MIAQDTKVILLLAYVCIHIKAITQKKKKKITLKLLEISHLNPSSHLVSIFSLVMTWKGAD